MDRSPVTGVSSGPCIHLAGTRPFDLGGDVFLLLLKLMCSPLLIRHVTPTLHLPPPVCFHRSGPVSYPSPSPSSSSSALPRWLLILICALAGVLITLLIGIAVWYICRLKLKRRGEAGSVQRRECNECRIMLEYRILVLMHRMESVR